MSTNGDGMLVSRAALIELLALVEAAGRTFAEIVAVGELDDYFEDAARQLCLEVFGLEGGEWAKHPDAVDVYARAAEIEAEALGLLDFTPQIVALGSFAAELRSRAAADAER